ncbi:MAG: glucose-1-phosphate cytidylyltransferase [Jiangellaceae bacterium]
MKVGILAGGLGSRLAEETETKPKPMVEIGGRPILWHIMKYYTHFGYNQFAIALGYKGEIIKRWAVDYASLMTDIAVDFRSGKVSHLAEQADGVDDWQVTLVDTGQTTNTGGRIKRLVPHLGPDTFFLTWGDGVSTVDLHALLDFHRSHGKVATLTAVRPQARYGHLDLDGDRIVEFSEKPQLAEGWINGAFFVLEPEVVDFIDGDATQFEREPLERLAAEGQLMAYRHDDFWQCMDSIRDKKLLEDLWADKPPWKVWS